MRRMVVMMMAGVVLAVGCASTIDYSKYTSEQLRQQLFLEQKTVNFHVGKVERRQYEAVYGNEDRPGQGVTASGGLLHALAGRVHDNRAQAIRMELIRRGDWNPDDIK
jgi:hypothetical protein